MKKSLTLSPTKSPSIYSVALSDGYSVKIIGKYLEASKTFSCFRNEKKHLHRSSGSLAINEMVLELTGLRWIEILYTDASGRLRELKTSREFILRFGTVAAYQQTNFEKQIFLPLNLWGLENAIKYEQQINSQMGLFA